MASDPTAPRLRVGQYTVDLQRMVLCRGPDQDSRRPIQRLVVAAAADWYLEPSDGSPPMHLGGGAGRYVEKAYRAGLPQYFGLLCGPRPGYINFASMVLQPFAASGVTYRLRRQRVSLAPGGPPSDLYGTKELLIRADVALRGEAGLPRRLLRCSLEVDELVALVGAPPTVPAELGGEWCAPDMTLGGGAAATVAITGATPLEGTPAGSRAVSRRGSGISALGAGPFSPATLHLSPTAAIPQQVTGPDAQSSQAALIWRKAQRGAAGVHNVWRRFLPATKPAHSRQPLNATEHAEEWGSIAAACDVNPDVPFTGVVQRVMRLDLNRRYLRCRNEVQYNWAAADPKGASRSGEEVRFIPLSSDLLGAVCDPDSAPEHIAGGYVFYSTLAEAAAASPAGTLLLIALLYAGPVSLAKPTPSPMMLRPDPAEPARCVPCTAMELHPRPAEPDDTERPEGAGAASAQRPPSAALLSSRRESRGSVRPGSSKSGSTAPTRRQSVDTFASSITGASVIGGDPDATRGPLRVFETHQWCPLYIVGPQGEMARRVRVASVVEADSLAPLLQVPHPPAQRKGRGRGGKARSRSSRASAMSRETPSHVSRLTEAPKPR